VLGRRVEPHALAEPAARHFGKVFGREIIRP